jgi:uncharacterized low-complexity protein
MRFAMILMAAVFALATSSVGEMSSAEAKAHVTKGKPGKCGPFKFYSKKDKGCLDKRG